MEMPISPQIPPELTPPIVYLRGQFSLGKFSVPYFSSVVPISFSQDKFKLIEEIPESERLEWTLDELFQREISWERITGSLIHYLTSENQPQFFNSLTIALLPREGEGFAGEYKTEIEYDQISDTNLDPPIQVGGIQIQPYKNSNGGSGKIRWDVREIIPVAVDGQHRLAALKELKQRVKYEKYETSSIPVIFIIPDNRVGFIEPPLPKGAMTTVTTLRRIFIDLNKNARSVSTTRNILLDDQEVESVCTRTLIGEKLSDKQEKDRIPLPMVDWVSGKNKFDMGPFLTTILVLHQIVTEALKTPAFEDLDPDSPRISEWLSEKFNPDDKEHSDILSQIQRCINREMPIVFMPTEIDTLKNLFAKQWRPLIHSIFHDFGPYNELREFCNSSGLLKPEFINLYIAENYSEGRDKDKATKIENSIKEADPDWNKKRDYYDKLEHIDKNIKGDNWAFKVVFQKALFKSFLRLLEQASSIVEGEKDPYEIRIKFTEQWIEALNSLFDSPLSSSSYTFSKPKESFWKGIGLKFDSTIDITNTSSERIAAWLTTWFCLYWLGGDRPPFNKLKDDNRFLVTCIKNSFKSKRTSTDGFARILRADGELSEEEILFESKKMHQKRYDYLRKLAQEIKKV
jgi:hypothetical protein